MAKIAIKPTITMNLTLSLTEVEVRALEALGGYGANEFLKHFYSFLGEAYMRPYETGLRSFLETLRDDLHQYLPGWIMRERSLEYKSWHTL